MPLDPIQRRPISDPVRAEYQERVARVVEAADPEPFLAAYKALPRTHQGRYVAANMMKEIFPEFSSSREGRTQYNIPLHNSAAVLASEQFRRAVADANRPERDTAIFLTGIPGAGKTSAVLDNRQLSPEVRVVYEGQLARPEAAIPKIQAALDAGLKVKIIAIHVQPEQALENTFEHFEKEGRGAGVEAMASIQGNLPKELAAIREYFGEEVGLAIIDRRAGMNRSQRLEGWDKLGELASEGDYERIKERIHAAINRHEAAGTASPGAIREARGLPPLARSERLHRPTGAELEHPPAGSAQGNEHGQLPAAGVQPGAVSQAPLPPAARPTPPTNSQAGTQGASDSKPAAVRFADRDCTSRWTRPKAEPSRSSGSPMLRAASRLPRLPPGPRNRRRLSAASTS
jgi:hypothetical protein